MTNQIFPLEKAIEVCSEIIKGLEYLDGEGYLHRDIKPGNILVTMENKKKIYKLADFGFTKR